MKTGASKKTGKTLVRKQQPFVSVHQNNSVPSLPPVPPNLGMPFASGNYSDATQTASRNESMNISLDPDMIENAAGDDDAVQFGAVPIVDLEKIFEDLQIIKQNQQQIIQEQQNIGTTNQTIFREQEELKRLIIEQSEYVRNDQPLAGRQLVDNYDDLPTMPFTTTADLLAFQTTLDNNEHIQNRFAQWLSGFGGDTYRKAANNTLKQVLTDELCSEVSWTGVGNTYHFSESIIATIFIRVIRMNRQCTIAEVEAKIADWLRRCEDRIRARNNQLQRRQERAESWRQRANVHLNNEVSNVNDDESGDEDEVE